MMGKLMNDDRAEDRGTYTIAGAGPAGLSAAITLAQAGEKVIVHEAKQEVGSRFQQDLQGLENWTTEVDVLDELRSFGLKTSFDSLPCKGGTVFDHWGRNYPFSSRVPIFYMVKRGPGPGTLDYALLQQARELGVEVHFNSRLQKVSRPAILATGPKAADAIAVGYHFETKMENGFWVICDDDLAPKGYAYLLIMKGQGTMKSCMFSGFKDEKLYVDRTVATFQRLVGLKMDNPVFHGGVGNFRMPASAVSGPHPVAGEQAGFQDTLWGFGMRFAIRSGVMAARGLLSGSDYDRQWQHNDFQGLMQCAVINRAVYAMLGNRGYRWYLRRMSRLPDIRRALSRQYRYTLMKKLLSPLARMVYRSQRNDVSCQHVECQCVWCRGCAT